MQPAVWSVQLGDKTMHARVLVRPTAGEAHATAPSWLFSFLEVSNVLEPTRIAVGLSCRRHLHFRRHWKATR